MDDNYFTSPIETRDQMNSINIELRNSINETPAQSPHALLDQRFHATANVGKTTYDPIESKYWKYGDLANSDGKRRTNIAFR